MQTVSLPISQKDLSIFFIPEITSEQEDHRLSLRKLLLDEISKQTKVNIEQILNLEQLPKVRDFTISLSHSKAGSSFCFAKSKNPIGIDIESIDRIGPKLIKRIASQEEITQCPQPKMLFGAKEAAWKALNKPLQIATIPQVVTHQWKNISKDWYQFNVQTSDSKRDGFGFVHEFSGIYLSFYWSSSTFI